MIRTWKSLIIFWSAVKGVGNPSPILKDLSSFESAILCYFTVTDKVQELLIQDQKYIHKVQYAGFCPPPELTVQCRDWRPTEKVQDTGFCPLPELTVHSRDWRPTEKVQDAGFCPQFVFAKTPDGPFYYEPAGGRTYLFPTDFLLTLRNKINFPHTDSPHCCLFANLQFYLSWHGLLMSKYNVEVCAHVRGLNVLETSSVYFVAILRLSRNNVGDTAFSTEI